MADGGLPDVRVADLLDERTVVLGLEAKDRDAALRGLAAALCRARPIPGDRRRLVARLAAREEMGSTAVGDGAAIPHCRVRGLREPALLLGVSPGGVPFGAPDGRPVRLFFLLASSPDEPARGLRVLASVARLLRSRPGLADRLTAGGTPSAVLAALAEEEVREPA